VLSLYFLVAFLLLAYPLFCRYDVSKSTLWYYDFFSMNPNILWYLPILVATIGVATYVKGRFSLFLLLSIVLVFSVVEVLGNYPLIFAGDVYVQGSSVKVIVEEGRLAEAWNTYHTTYPGTFLLWAIVKLVTGMSIKVSNLMVLLPITILLLPLLLVVLYRKLGTRKNATYAIALLAFLLMNNQGNELTFLHFNTRLYSLDLLILALLLFFVRERKNKREEIILYVIIFSLTISHVLNSLIPVAFLFLYWLFEDKCDLKFVHTALLSATIYLAWNINMAIGTFGLGIRSLASYYHLALGLDAIARFPTVPGYAPFFGVALKTYFKGLIVVLTLISIYSALKLRYKWKIRRLFYILLSVSVVYGTTLFSAVLVNAVDRALVIAPISLAPLSFFAIIQKRNSVLKPSKLLILSFLLLFLIIPNFTLVHEQPFATGDTGPVDACSEFVFEHKHTQQIVLLTSVSFWTYYSLQEPKFESYVNLKIYEHELPSGRHNLSDIANFLLDNRTSGIRVLDIRNVIEWSYMSPSFDEARKLWASEVYAPLESRYSKIYDNSFETLYHQTKR
jgi:hypothetical protein